MITPKTEPAVPDSSDVVTGPVGRARLRDPASAEVRRTGEGADLAELEPIPDPDESPGRPDVQS
jgi:hypothetical protein